MAVTHGNAGGDETLVATPPTGFTVGSKGITAGANIELTSDADSVTVTGTNVMPTCIVKNDANILVTNSGSTTITFNTDLYDPDDMHSTSTNTERINILENGIYEAVFYCATSGYSSATGPVYVVMYRVTSGPTTSVISGDLSKDFGGTGATPNLTATVIINLLAGDYLYAVVFNNSGADLNVTGTSNHTPKFMVSKLSDV